MAVLAIFLLASGIPASAGDADIFSRPLRSESAGAFEETCDRLSAHSLVRGNFEQEKTLNRLGRSLVSKGNFIIAAGLGMVWETLTPFPSTLAVGKDFLIQSKPGGRKTRLDTGGNETFLRLAEVISAVFSGNSRILLENFEVYFSGNPEGWELGLLPLDKAIGSFAAKISMGGDSAIRFILVTELNGDTVKYLLSNHRYSQELTADEEARFFLP
jgi:hypothetical protein